MRARHTLAIVATFIAAGIATTYLPVTESVADAPRPAVTSTPSPTPSPVIDITGPDGTVHSGCVVTVGDTSTAVCPDGFTAES